MSTRARVLRITRHPVSDLNVREDAHPIHRPLLKKMAEALAQYGQKSEVIVNLGTITKRPYEVISGYGVVLAAREAQLRSLEIVLIDTDDETVRSFLETPEWR